MKNNVLLFCLAAWALGPASTPAQIPLLVCDQANVLYVGVDNTVSLYLPAALADSLELTLSEGAIVHENDNHYTVRVSRPGQVDIVVRAGGRLLGRFSLRAKRIPDPAPVLSGASLRKNTSLSAADMREIRGLTTLLENFDYDAHFSTVQYTLTRIDSAGKRSSAHNLGARFELPARQLVAQAAAGDIFLFTDIEVQCAGEEASRQINNYAVLVH